MTRGSGCFTTKELNLPFEGWEWKHLPRWSRDQREGGPVPGKVLDHLMLHGAHASIFTVPISSLTPQRTQEGEDSPSWGCGPCSLLCSQHLKGQQHSRAPGKITGLMRNDGKAGVG